MDFNVMRNMIDEFNKLCDIAKGENETLAREIEKRNEVTYFDMCTDLAPYYALWLDKKLPSIYIDLDTKIKYYGETCIPVICFHANSVYIATRHDDGLAMHTITKRRDFKAYEDLIYGGDHIAVDVAKKWFDHADEFERKFMVEVQKILTARAEKLNRDNEYLRELLGTK